MTSTHISKGTARSTYHPLGSRASSATLFLSRLSHSYVDGATDPFDMIIAQGLLQTRSPRIPRRRSSFIHSTNAQQRHLPADVDDHLTVDGPSHGRGMRQILSSNTWTSSSGGGSEANGPDDRTPFVEEYNRLAKKYGVQTILPNEFIAVNVDKFTVSAKPSSWIMRKLLRRTSSVQAPRHKTEKRVQHKRSVSDISLRIKTKKDNLKGKDLIELIRLCGASALYLPAEYAASTLAVPTCFRATAQYLVQHAATTRGIFRIPGAHSTINDLYNHYASQDEDGEVIDGTIRCPTLPEHIQCNVHDVASAFKKFLAGLPGGILGTTWLFDAFVSIHNQLDATAELMRTKQSKVRARLIALAIATVAPRYQRELICAVLGLLSMIGRAAEIAPREDEHGRPLPTSDLMGYGALGTVFGPLLIGDLLDHHVLHQRDPHGSFAFIQHSPPKSSRGRYKKSKRADYPISLLQDTDKIRIINSITEMLITHWRDVVRHMKNLNALRYTKQPHSHTRENSGSPPRPLTSDEFAIRRPRDWDTTETSVRYIDRSRSPTPSSRKDDTYYTPGRIGPQQDAVLSVRKRRPRPRPMSSQILSKAKSMSILAPTIEEIPVEAHREHSLLGHHHEAIQSAPHLHERDGVKAARRIKTLPIARSDPLEISKQKDEALLNLNKQNDNGLEEQFSSKQSTKMDTVGIEKLAAMENRVSPSRDKQDLQKELPGQLGAMFSSPGSPKNTKDEPMASPEVPVGIISSHLRGIAASDPGCEPPFGFLGLWKTHHKAFGQPKRRPYTTIGFSNTVEGYPKDPLTRVSQEEDIASLVSLAEVIQSQNDILYLNSPPEYEPIACPDTPFNVLEPHTGNTISDTPISGLPIIEPVCKITDQESFRGQPKGTKNRTSSSNADKAPTTPHRSATESSLLSRSGGSSVKVLAARFENAEANAQQSPSPINIFESRRFRDSPIEEAVISPYTINASPIPISLALNGPGKSPRAMHDAIGAKRHAIVSQNKPKDTASSLLPKPILTKSYQENPGLQRSNLRSMDRSHGRAPSLVHTAHANIDPLTDSSSLHRTGDGNSSFTFSRKLSLGILLPKPNEPPVAGFVDYARPSMTPSDDYSSLSNFSMPTHEYFSGMSSFSLIGQNPSNPGISMLYSQIQYLHRQLRAKEDEVEHLRQQLAMKDSPNDKGTLAHELRRIRRDLALWRGRAEISEKSLEMLSRITQCERHKAIADEQSTIENPGIRDSRGIEERDQFQDWAGNSPHGLDGVNNDHELQESEGTIRRASSEHWCRS